MLMNKAMEYAKKFDDLYEEDIQEWEELDERYGFRDGLYMGAQDESRMQEYGRIERHGPLYFVFKDGSVLTARLDYGGPPGEDPRPPSFKAYRTGYDIHDWIDREPYCVAGKGMAGRWSARRKLEPCSLADEMHRMMPDDLEESLCHFTEEGVRDNSLAMIVGLAGMLISRRLNEVIHQLTRIEDRIVEQRDQLLGG